MRALTLRLVSVLAMFFSISVFADAKVIIQGEPVTMEPRGGIYYLPGNYTSTAAYHFVTIGGTKRVCYLERQPSLASLNVMPINVSVGTQRVQWQCYEYNPDFFEIAP